MFSLNFLITCLIVVLIPGTGVIFTVPTGLTAGKRASVFAAPGSSEQAPSGEGACSRWTAQQAHFQGRCAPQREQAPSPQVT